MQYYLRINDEERGPYGIDDLIGLGAAVICALGLIAFRLFLLMLVDLVDTMLHEHARSKYRE